MRKNSCLLTLLLLLLDIPLLAQSRSQASNSDVNGHNKPSLPASKARQLEFIGFENQFWKAMVSKDYKIIKDLVAQDALFIDNDYVLSKADFIRALYSYTPTQYLFTGLKVRMVTDKICIVSYKVKAKYSFNSTELPVTTALVTSVWVNQGGKWRLKHHHSGLMPVTKVDP